MRDYRIVVPRTLQNRLVELAHEGHQGICKIKALLRATVRFPDVDTAAEEAMKRCIPCQANTTRRDTEPLTMSPLPRGMSSEISIDCCGPLPTGECLLVLFDEFSRYPIVELTWRTYAETVIPVMDKEFSLFSFS